jgi:molecular chaperone DnaJ
MAVTARNLYGVLGVSTTADRDEIRTAFRRLAREHHPDVSAAPEADERFREVVEAYRTLSRPTARRMYDMFGHHGLGADAVEELARWLGARRRPSPAEVVGEVVLSFVEAARGGTHSVEVDTTWPCAGCKGGGAELGSAIERCESCGGSGRLRRSTSLGDGRLLQIESCPECDGSGRHVLRLCTLCGGEGRVRGRRPVEVPVPAGTADGDTIPVELGDRAGAVRVSVRSVPDTPLVRYAAVALLVAALAFLGFLLLP